MISFTPWLFNEAQRYYHVEVSLFLISQLSGYMAAFCDTFLSSNLLHSPCDTLLEGLPELFHFVLHEAALHLAMFARVNIFMFHNQHLG